MPVEMAGLFREEKPLASSAVWACVVYSLVPFVGIVFVPFIYIIGAAASLKGEPVDRRALVVGVSIFGTQLVLWWLLYVVPKWGMQV